MMKEMINKHKLFFLILAVLIVGFLVWYFAPIVVCIIAAGVVKIIAQPMVDRLDNMRIKRYSLPRTLAVALVLSLVVIVFLGILAIIIPLIIREANLIAQIDAGKFASFFNEEIDRIQTLLRYYGIIAEEETIAHFFKQTLMEVMNVGMVSKLLTNVFAVVGNFFFYFFTTLFLSFFFLHDRTMLKNFILLLFPAKYEQNAINILYSSKKLLTRYFIGLIAEVLALSVMVSAGLYIFGVRSAIPLGFFAGVMNIVPYIGYAIATIIGVVLGVTGMISIGDYAAILPVALKILGVFVVANMIDNSVLQPFFFGKSVKAGPVEIFLVIIAAGFIGGVIGMIVAVPAYTILRIVAREFLSEFRIVQKLTDHI